MAEDLDRLLAGEAIRARPEGWLRKQRRRAKRHRAALVTAMILALGLGVSSAVVWRYNQEQRVVRVRREFLAVLQENDGSPERLAELEDVLTRLEQLSPAQARASEQQWWESLEGIVRRNLAKPGKLQAEEAARMEDILRRLETRDPDRAKLLHEALDQRYRDWAVVLDLKPPFSERTRILGESLDLQEANGALWRKLPSGGEKAFNPVVHTRIPCAGDLEFEAVFDSSWEKAASLGLDLLIVAQRRLNFFWSDFSMKNAVFRGLIVDPVV